MIDISIVIPLYNEDESLPELEAWIRRVMEAEGFKYEIIMVDDGSKDRSWEVIQQLSTQNPNIRAIKFRRNYGKSPALNEGFRLSKGRVVVTMDADLQDSPDEVPILYKMIIEEKYDLVSGWKQKRHDPLSKTLPSKFFNAVVRRLTGIQLNDFNCGLKAYRHTVVKSIEIYGDMHRYIPVMAKWAGFSRIGEKIVQHQERKYGVSKFGWERLITGFLDLLSIMFVGKFGKRPMHLFGSLGVISFLVGLLILCYFTVYKLFGGNYIDGRPLFFLGMLTTIIGTQLFIGGFLAELIIRNAADRNTYMIDEEIN